MAHNPDDAWLLALGTAVCDQQQINWEQAEQRSRDLEQQHLVHQLRDVAAIVKAHRTLVSPDRSVLGPATNPTPVSEWRHLIVFECLGGGAFGRVYRAWDPRLDRVVAVKLLIRGKDHAASPLAEARHLAQIRHSNVVVVHGADVDSDRPGIWMEYIDGLTLAQIVAERGPMSAREVTGIGLDLCSALSAIHAAGLLHRDIKAHNVMREVGGRILLMDFSGAHAVTGDGAGAVVSGTPLYMAPEIFTGAPATPASDVYGLGVLLFFLLSGRLPVEGATMALVRQAHARGERRRLRDLRADVPDGLVQVVERSMDEQPARRYRTAGELEHALANASGAQSTLAVSPASTLPSPARATSRRFVLWSTAALLVSAIAVAWYVGRPAISRPWPGVARFTIGPPFIAGSWPRISPDGRFVVFGAFVQGRNRFWIHPVDRLAGRPLLQTTASETPFWSPDSSTLAFFDDEKLKTISIDGGEPHAIAEAPTPRGGDWSGDVIIYSREGGIYRMPSSGGPVQQLTAVDRQQGDSQHTWPKFLPDGKRFIYLIRSTNAQRNGIYVGSLDGSPSWRLAPAYSRTTYANGHLLYVRDGSLVAQPLDPQTASLSGEPVTLARGVGFHPRGDALFDASSNGILIYSVEGGLPSTRLMVHDRRGRELEALAETGLFGRPRFSPDGQRIVAEKFDEGDGNPELWVYGLSPRSATRLTRHPAPDVSPVWAPDGRRIAFSSKRSSVYDIFVKSVDAVAEERLLFTTPGDKYVEHWSPDGRYLTATVQRSGLWVIPVNGSEKPRQVRAGERAPTWQSEFSPDGRWLAYVSEESGKPEVYVEPFPGNGSRWQVSTHGGAEPHWIRDSNELLYLDSNSMLTSVRLTAPGWKPGTPQRVFPMAIPDLMGRSDFTVSPDGRLLVINTFVSDPVVPPIDVVVNWPSLTRSHR